MHLQYSIIVKTTHKLWKRDFPISSFFLQKTSQVCPEVFATC